MATKKAKKKAKTVAKKAPAKKATKVSKKVQKVAKKAPAKTGKVVAPPKLNQTQITLLKRLAASPAPIDSTAFDKRTLRPLVMKELVTGGKATKLTAKGTALVGTVIT